MQRAGLKRKELIMPYSVTIKGKFDAAHHLRNYPGKYANPHGHSFYVELEVSGDSLDDLGMLIDFNDLKEWLDNILDIFDHLDLNELPMFRTKNPTAENLARWIFNEIERRIPDQYKLHPVKVWEGPDSYASYWGEE